MNIPSNRADSAGAVAPGPRLRVRASRGACCGYGVCAEICPQVYRLDDNGVVVVISEIVPIGLEGRAREGAAACPQGAIEVHEE